MRLALVQSDIYWEDIQANLSMFEEKIWKVDKVVDVIVLPEMFTTGFSMNAAQLAEPTNLTTQKWMKQMAGQTQAAICGSYIVKENGHYFNRFLWVQPDGISFAYDKRHLFTLAEEHKTFTAGVNNSIITWRGWKFLPQICYDLRFPVWSRNEKGNSYDCLIYVANWPNKRAMAWNALLKARAIENLSYSIGVNRIGVDGKGLYYSGDSSAYDFVGNQIAFVAESDTILFVDLDKKQLDSFRKDFPALDDADSFILN